MISQINLTVGARDRLIVLGDFCWKDPQKYRKQILCREVWLIYGNHDKRSWGQCFSIASDTEVVQIGPNAFPVFLSHYPHAYWPGSHRGHGHLYGHVHDAREETLNGKFPNRRSQDVGVDSAKRILGTYRPFSDVEICEALCPRKGHDLLDYYERYDEHRKMYQVNAAGSVVCEPPSMETRPATTEDVFRWMSARSLGVPVLLPDNPRES